MKKQIIKIILVSACIAFFVYTCIYETHDIYSLAKTSTSKKICGSSFIETTTFDGLMLKENKLFDIYSLTPEMLQEKDCST